MDLIVKTLIIYFLIIFTLRFMGKREIGQLGLFDFVVLLLIADVSSVAIDDKISFLDIEFLKKLFPVFTLAITQKLLAILSLKINKLRNIIDGNESIIIYKGKLNIKEMKKQNYNVNDLITQLRLKNVKSLSQVEHLILENNGEISVFLYDDKNVDTSSSTNKMNQVHSSVKPNEQSNINSNLTKNSKLNNNSKASIKDISVYPLIISGEIQKENIKLLNISREWIDSELNKMNLKVEDVYYGNLENGKLFVIETCDI